MIRWSAVLLLLSTTPSHAVLECLYYDQGVAAAALVVQIETPKVSPADANGDCAVTGPATRVFAGTLVVGDWVTALVPCDNALGMVGQTLWTDATALATAKVVELHLDEDGSVAGYGAGIALLDTVSQSPMWKPICGAD